MDAALPFKTLYRPEVQYGVSKRSKASSCNHLQLRKLKKD